jgi:ankyrin repeat protein
MGHTNTLKTLINNDGFNHFYQSDEGLTYVMYAAAFGREEILGMLIKSDCEIYKEGMFGDTAIKLVRRQRLRNLYTENLISAYKLTELQLLRSGVT